MKGTENLLMGIEVNHQLEVGSPAINCRFLCPLTEINLFLLSLLLQVLLWFSYRVVSFEVKVHMSICI